MGGLLAKEVSLQRVANDAQTAHERQMLTDMGHLEDQLETWKQAENNMERRMFSQQAAISFMKTQQAKALRDEEEAATVWRCCKFFMCALTILGLATCVYVARLQRAWQCKVVFTAMESASPMETMASLPDHKELIEEDIAQVTMQAPHPALTEKYELGKPSDLGKGETSEEVASTNLIEASDVSQHAEDVQAGDDEMSSCCHKEVATTSFGEDLVAPQPTNAAPTSNTEAKSDSQQEVVEQSKSRVSESEAPKCEYFSLAEDANVEPRRNHSAEEDWWMD